MAIQHDAFSVHYCVIMIFMCVAIIIIRDGRAEVFLINSINRIYNSIFNTYATLILAVKRSCNSINNRIKHKSLKLDIFSLS